MSIIPVLILLVANGARSEGKCKHECQAPSGSQNLNYEQGKTYVYEFNGDLDLTLPNAENQKSNTQVKSTVFVTPQPGCTYVLHLQNFRIVSANQQTYENLEGIDKPITFQYLNGAVGPEICAEEDDDAHSLNVKRAVVSMFQLDRNAYQTDVFGVCPTVNEIEMHDEDTIIRKTRMLNQCDKREHLDKNFMADALKDKKILENVPILSSHFTSVQNVTGGLLRRAAVLEDYVYMAAESRRENGVKAMVKSTLEYTGTIGDMTPNLKADASKLIIFDGTLAPVSKDSARIVDFLLSFADEKLALTEDTTSNFLNLIKMLRESNKEMLSRVYETVSSKRNVRKVFLDALLRSGTEAGLTVGLQLLSSGQLEDGEKTLLYLGLSYIRHPTAEVLKLIGDLLKGSVPKEAYLGIGDLIWRYCEHHTCPDAVTAEIITAIGNKLDAQPVYVLKALLNANQLPKDTMLKVLAMIQNAKSSTHLRSVALDVLSIAACQPEARTLLVNILRNEEEDEELRIKSYLALTECPNPETAQVIESVVNNERSYQVGGFIASHLKTQTNILSSIKVEKNFPKDPRKYSFITEMPHGLGGTTSRTTASVVYSKKSFLPRLARLNTTADILGSNINILEMEMRQENFERTLEHILGPVGVARQQNKELRNEPETYRDAGLSLDLGVKLFGTDVLFLSYDDESGRFADVLVTDLVDSIRSKMNFDVNTLNNVLFVDSQLSYPTSLGFPLRMSVEGAASVQLRMEGNSGTDYYKWGVLPSANLEIVSSIGVDARVVESGVKIVSRMHVATGAVVEQLNNGDYGNEIKLSLPLQNQKAMVSHDIFFNERELGDVDLLKPVVFPHNEESTECIKQLPDYTGLDLCVKLNVPPRSVNMYLAGSYKAALILNNTDFSHLSLKKGNYVDSVTSDRKIELSMRAVGKNQDTKTGLIFDVTLNKGFAGKITAVMPTQNASIDARYINELNEKSVSAELSLGDEKYVGKVGVAIESLPDKDVYTPIMYMTISEKYLVETKGSVVIHRKNRDFKIVLDDLRLILEPQSNAKIYSVGGRFEQDKYGYFLDFMMSDGSTTIQTNDKLRFYRNKVKFDGHLTNNRYPEVDLHVNYEFMAKQGLYRSNLEIVHGEDPKSTVNRLTIKNWGDFITDIKIVNKITYPAADFETRFNYEYTRSSLTYDIELRYQSIVCGSNINAKLGLNHPDDHDISLVAYGADVRVGFNGTRIIQDGNNLLNYKVYLNEAVYELSGQMSLPKPENDYVVDLVMKIHNPVPFIVTGHFDFSFMVNNVKCQYTDVQLSSTPVTINFASEVKVEYGERTSDVFKLETSTILVRQSSYSIKSYGAIQVDAVKSEFEANIDVGSESGKIMISVKSPSTDQIVLSSDYALLQDYNQIDFNLNVSQASTNLFSAQTSYSMKPTECDIGARFEYMSFPVSLKLRAKEIEYAKAYYVFAIVDVNSKKYELMTQANIDAKNPKFNVELDLGVIDQLFIELDLTDSDVTKGNFTLSSHFLPLLVKKKWTYQNLHKFDLDCVLDFPSIGASDVRVVLSNTPTRLSDVATDTITYDVSIWKEDFISGSTNISSIASQDSIVYACTSVVRLRNNGPKEYNNEVDNAATKTNTRTLDITLTLSRNGVKITQLYCEPQQPCFEIRAQHKNNYENDKTQLEEFLLMDLRYFGGRVIKFSESYTMSPDSMMANSQLSFDDRYEYVINITDTDREESFVLQTPHRQVLLKSTRNMEKPMREYIFTFHPRVGGTDQGTTVTALWEPNRLFEMTLADPRLARDLKMLYTVVGDEHSIVLDIFKRENDKIIITSESNCNTTSNGIRSEGLGFEYGYKRSLTMLESGFEYTYTTTHRFGEKTYNNFVIANVKDSGSLYNVMVLNKNVFTLSTQRSGTPKETVVTANLEMIGVEPVTARWETKYNRWAKATVSKGANVFELTAKILGKELMRVETMNNDVLLSTTSLAMVDHALKYDFRYDGEAIDEQVLKPAKLYVKQSLTVLTDYIFQKSDEMNANWRQLKQGLIDTKPDFKDFLSFYYNELNAFGEEMKNEPVRDLTPILSYTVWPVFDFVQYVTVALYEGVDSYVLTTLNQEWNLLYNNVAASRDVVEVTFSALDELNMIVKYRQNDIRRFGTMVCDAFEDVLTVAHIIRFSLLRACKHFEETVRLNTLAYRLSEGTRASENLIQDFKEVVNDLRKNSNATEVVRLLELVTDHKEKKEDDDEMMLEEIGEVLGKILSLTCRSDDEDVSWGMIRTLVHVWYLQTQVDLNKVPTARAVSEDVKTMLLEKVEDNKFPESFVGIMTQNHIFTFDGKHLTPVGDCELLLVEDAIDGNFSISVRYQESLSSLTFNGKHSMVSFGANGGVRDGKKSGGVTLFRPELNINVDEQYVVVDSRYGAELKCDRALTFCTVKVSGYYHTHLKGLLGNANHESYDDFALAPTTDEFLAMYKTDTCTKISTPTNVPINPQCTSLFTKPNLKWCNAHVNTYEYEAACSEGLQLQIPKTEDAISRAYAARCLQYI